ncbi:PAS domain S-box protein [Pseudodesulfovibrio sp.]|nr:PAS domain S-box protein [Pseudodesulfovibrio sp.]
MRFRENLIVKIIVATGGIMLVCTLVLVYLSISFVNEHTLAERIHTADMMGNTIKLGLHNAMLHNSRGEIDQIIKHVAELQPVTSIRVYNKDGEIKFSNNPEEEGTVIDTGHQACRVCHLVEPPKKTLPLDERTRDFYAADGEHYFSVLTPIGNPPECSGGPCHFHPADKAILGALEIVISFDDTDAVVSDYRMQLIFLGTIFFLITSGGIFLGLRQIITRPLSMLIKSSKDIAEGKTTRVNIPIATRGDELGKLARSHMTMVKALQVKQEALNEKMREYELLFDNVPCIVTVQDRDYKLLEYNKESRERFNPFPGAYCYQAYKGVDEKCEICPVEKTFETGVAHCSEESRQNPDGTYSHWIVHTAPIVDQDGNVTKAMEMCLDITERKKLEEQLKESEKKYHTIFNNVPNSIFVLDNSTLNILDCNTTASYVYGYEAKELVGRPFTSLIHPDAEDAVIGQLRGFSAINQVKSVRKDGEPFFVDIMLAASGHSDQEYLLVSTTDITERLEAEQLLIHAGKMATLGEMATGVAHELNQPLTVIKTASNFFIKKTDAGEPIPQETLATLAKEVDSYVDRATRIINHMREFGRKVDQTMEKVDVNQAVEKAFTLLNKQFTARGIQMHWELGENLPPVMASCDQLEQVFINLFVNARDALEEKTGNSESGTPEIYVRTMCKRKKVFIEIEDNGGGIPENLIHKVFEPFFTTKKVGKGTGLGLSISYGLIKDFGGSIHAENSGAGALFTIKLPVAEG